MIQLPDRVSEGRPVSARAFNMLRDAVASVSRVSAGPGIQLTAGMEGLVIAAMLSGTHTKMGIITAAPPATPVLPPACRYSFRLEEDPTVEVVNALPAVRFIDDLARIRPARVNDPCLVFRRGDGTGALEWFLWAITERIASATCV